MNNSYKMFDIMAFMNYSYTMFDIMVFMNNSYKMLDIMLYFTLYMVMLNSKGNLARNNGFSRCNI